MFHISSSTFYNQGQTCHHSTRRFMNNLAMSITFVYNDAVKSQAFHDFKQQMLEFTENMNTKMESLSTEVNQYLKLI